MGETLPPQTQTHPEMTGTSRIPEQKKAENIESIENVQDETTLAVAAFLDSLELSSSRNQTGIDLAHRITDSLATPDEDEADDGLDILRGTLAGTNAFADEVIYEHKSDNDPIFQRLIDILQSTKTQQRSLQEQRRAALKLTELRGIIPEDVTERDAQWHRLIDRLFT